MATDKQLIDSWREGSLKAFSVFYKRHSRRVYAYLLSIVGEVETAEELLQETFLRVYKNLNRIKDHDDLSPYITVIARNLTTDRFRRSHREKQSMATLQHGCLLEQNGSQHKIGLSPVDASDLLWRLPDLQRETIILKIYCSFSFSEIGFVMGVSLNTAVSRYRYGLEKLKDMLQGGEYDISQKR